MEKLKGKKFWNHALLFPASTIEDREGHHGLIKAFFILA
jgi:hypothetical protein